MPIVVVNGERDVLVGFGGICRRRRRRPRVGPVILDLDNQAALVKSYLGVLQLLEHVMWYCLGLQVL